MAVYRFKVSFEEYDDVVREIDIKAAQSFKDLHLAILNSIGFDQKHPASFFISDDMWRWGDEIVLSPEHTETGLEGKKKGAVRKLMDKSRLVNSIEDPHQKFIYVYDYEVQWVILVELVKILNAEAGKSYPFCSKSTGQAPRQYKVVLPPPEEETSDLEALLMNPKNKLVQKPEENGKEDIVETTEMLDEEDLPGSTEIEEEDSGGEEEIMDEENGEGEESGDESEYSDQEEA